MGGLFKAGEIYIKPFSETLHQFAPLANLIQLTVPPVVGAVLLAGERIGLDTLSIRKPLIQSTINWINFEEV
jgi:hypothetical protein